MYGTEVGLEVASSPEPGQVSVQLYVPLSKIEAELLKKPKLVYTPNP